MSSCFGNMLSSCAQSQAVGRKCPSAFKLRRKCHRNWPHQPSSQGREKVVDESQDILLWLGVSRKSRPACLSIMVCWRSVHDHFPIAFAFWRALAARSSMWMKSALRWFTTDLVKTTASRDGTGAVCFSSMSCLTFLLIATKEPAGAETKLVSIWRTA